MPVWQYPHGDLDFSPLGAGKLPGRADTFGRQAQTKALAGVSLKELVPNKSFNLPAQNNSVKSLRICLKIW